MELMKYYTFKVTGKGSYGAPKGASVQVIRTNSTSPYIGEIQEAFQKQLGIKISGGTPSGFDIEKLF